MKLDFCCVCGATNDLVEHHIDPVVYTGINRKRKKNPVCDKTKPIGDCSIEEIFMNMMERGAVTDEGTITVCGWHHNIIHGIVRYHKYTHSEMIKAALKKAVDSGKKLGRPTNVTPEIKAGVILMREAGMSLHAIAKKFSIGVDNTRKIVGYVVPPPKTPKPPKIAAPLSIEEDTTDYMALVATDQLITNRMIEIRQALLESRKKIGKN